MDLWGGMVKQFSLFFDPTPTNDDKGEEGKVLSRLGREEKCAVSKLASLSCSLQVPSAGSPRLQWNWIQSWRHED